MRLPLPDKFVHHRKLIAEITDAGVPPPSRWTELNDRLDAYLSLPDDAAQRLAAAVVNPSKNTELTLLRAIALAEQSAGPERVAAVNRVVIAEIEQAMLDAYAPEAMKIYRRLADQFDALADEFAQLANLVDCEADPRDMVSASDEQRQAWLNAELRAASLDGALPPLAAAAQLAGIRLDAPNLQGDGWWHAKLSAGALLALTVHTDGLHRRRVWEAWESTGRCGRWTALVSLGAHIEAHSLDGFEPYREPRPLIHRQQQVPGAPLGNVENLVLDPEDDDYREPVEPMDPVIRPSGVFV